MTRHDDSQNARRTLNKTKVFWYFVSPMLLSAAFMAMFFSGVRLLETLVAAPYLEAMPMNSRREFGLLENLQHLILLVVVVVAIRAAVEHGNRGVKIFMTLVAIGATVLFLEEIDYGLHYYEYLADVPHDQVAETRNLHNVSNRTALLKNAADALMILVFGMAPFVWAKVKKPWVRYFLPDPYMALLLIAGFLTRTIARALHGRGLGQGLGLDSNLSEFRELITYYHCLAYTLYLARRSPDTFRVTHKAKSRRETP